MDCAKLASDSDMAAASVALGHDPGDADSDAEMPTEAIVSLDDELPPGMTKCEVCSVLCAKRH